jgi:hypothetical protein
MADTRLPAERLPQRTNIQLAQARHHLITIAHH